MSSLTISPEETLSPLLLLVKTLCSASLPETLRQQLLDTLDFSMGDRSLCLNEEGVPTSSGWTKDRLFLPLLFDQASEQDLMRWLTEERLTRSTKGRDFGHFSHSGSSQHYTVLDPDTWSTALACALKAGYHMLFMKLLEMEIPEKTTRLQDSLRFTDRSAVVLPLPNLVEACLESSAPEGPWRLMMEGLATALGNAFCAQWTSGGPSPDQMRHHALQRIWQASTKVLAYNTYTETPLKHRCTRAGWLASLLVPEPSMQRESLQSLASAGPMAWPVLQACMQHWYGKTGAPLTVDQSIGCLPAFLPKLWGTEKKNVLNVAGLVAELDEENYKAGYAVLSQSLEAFPAASRTLPFMALADSWIFLYTKRASALALTTLHPSDPCPEEKPTLTTLLHDMTRLPGWNDALCHPMEAFSWLCVIQKLYQIDPQVSETFTECIRARWNCLADPFPPFLYSASTTTASSAKLFQKESLELRWLEAYGEIKEHVYSRKTLEALTSRLLEFEPQEGEEMYQRWCTTFGEPLKGWLKRGFQEICKKPDRHSELFRGRIEQMILNEEIKPCPERSSRPRQRV